MNIIEQNSEQIQKLCSKHKVDQMFVFGSVITKDFNENSDVDFLVKFGKIDLYEYFENLLNLKENLEKILLRKVDILEMQALKNPYLKKSIDNNKLLIYGSETSEMAL
jgi:predicted nucleotidyltransferase